MVAFSGANSYSGSPNGNEATKRKVAFPKILGQWLPVPAYQKGGVERQGDHSVYQEKHLSGVQQDRFEKRKV